MRGWGSFTRTLVDEIERRRRALTSDCSLLVGISGIDGAGKGFMTARLAKCLGALGRRVAVISADDWLNLPEVCINHDNPAEHFYKHAMRFDEMFERLVTPLRQARAVDLVAYCGDARAKAHHRLRYSFRNIDIVLIEGIFLFKPAYRHHFDLTAWIDCSFSTALQRAIARGQEGLSPIETERAFKAIYFPAQRIHLARDNPSGAADIIVVNDPQLPRLQ